MCCIIQAYSISKALFIKKINNYNACAFHLGGGGECLTKTATTHAQKAFHLGREGVCLTKTTTTHAQKAFQLGREGVCLTKTTTTHAQNKLITLVEKESV
jgi:hypothetical protein